MKKSSNCTAKAFSDAALMIRYHYMLLSKAAESAHRRPPAHNSFAENGVTNIYESVTKVLKIRFWCNPEVKHFNRIWLFFKKIPPKG
jgi:hypothetical protein